MSVLSRALHCPKRTSKHEEDEEENEEHEYHQDYARTISIKLPITLRYTNIAVEIHVFPGKWSTNGASSMETFHYQRVKSHKFYIWCLNQLTIPWITTFSPIFCRNLHWSRWIRFVTLGAVRFSWSRRQGEGSEVGHHRVAGHDIQRYSPDLVLMDRMDSNIW